MKLRKKTRDNILGKKSLKLNMVLNAIKGMMSVIFPLITFPYVSRVLGVDEIGKYNFASSVINYFVLLAGLGISSYSIREGARFRDNRKKIQSFASEMFSINIISTVISYLFLFAAMLFVPKLSDYSNLIFIFSLQIVFQTIGIEWIYSIYEDYFYITIRSIIFQVISLALLLIFVRNSNDVNIYAGITVFSSAGASIFNYIHARKYCKVSIIKNINWKKHLKPIMVLFGMAVTVTIYVSSDVTMLGFMCSDYEVGIYSVSVKIYSIIKSIIAAIVTVSIPRMSALFEEDDKEKITTVVSDIYNTLLTLTIPAVVGMIILREEIILIVSGSSYLGAVPSLVILSITMLLCLGAYFWGQAILVPVKKEGICFKASLISAIVCIGLNLILIPIGQEKATAFTTLIAEGMAFLICRREGIKYIKLNGTLKTVFKSIIGCIGIIVVSLFLRPLKGQTIIYTVLIVTISFIVYVVSQILLKNESILNVVSSIKNKFSKKEQSI